MFIHNIGLGDPTTCVYQFIFDKKDINGTQIKQYFVMHRLGLCTILNSYVLHMLYEW